MNPWRSQAAAALLFLSVGWGAIAPAASAALPSDVNGDNATNVSDALLTLRAAIGAEPLTPAQFAAADVAPRPGEGGRLIGDARIDVQDAIRILQYIVGLLTAEQIAPAEPLALYTLNAGPRCNGPATVSVVDLPRLATAPNEAVTLAAFGTGAIPNHMVIRDTTGYLANSGAHTLQIIDLRTNQTLGTVDLGANTNPMQVALDGEKAYVTLLLTGEVAVVDLNRREVTGRIATGEGATGILAAGGKLYVTNTAFEGFDPVAMVSRYGPGTVSVIDPATDTVVKVLAVPTNPQDMALDSLGRLHVVSVGNYSSIPGRVSVFNTATDELVGNVPIGGSPGFITVTFEDKAYLGDSVNGVTSYDARTLTVLRGPDRAIKISPFAWDVASDNRGRVFVASLGADRVFVLDSATDAVQGEIPVGPCPEAITVR